MTEFQDTIEKQYENLVRAHYILVFLSNRHEYTDDYYKPLIEYPINISDVIGIFNSLFDTDYDNSVALPIIDALFENNCISIDEKEKLVFEKDPISNFIYSGALTSEKGLPPKRQFELARSQSSRAGIWMLNRMITLDRDFMRYIERNIDLLVNGYVKGVVGQNRDIFSMSPELDIKILKNNHPLNKIGAVCARCIKFISRIILSPFVLILDIVMWILRFSQNPLKNSAGSRRENISNISHIDWAKWGSIAGWIAAVFAPVGILVAIWLDYN